MTGWIARALVPFGIVFLVGPDPAIAGKANDTLIWATEQEVPSTDPYFTQIRENIIIYRNICDGLLYRNPETLEYEPLLAKSHKWVDDLTLDFVLREDVKFHDGRKFSAKDVVYTVNFVIDPDHGVLAQNSVNWMKGAEALSEYKVRIHLKKTYPVALEYIVGELPILPAGHYDNAPEIGGGGKKNYGAVPTICTGPYKVVKVVPGEAIDFVINEDYFDGPKGQPSIGKLKFRTLPDPETQIAELMTGGVDWIWGIAKDKAEQLAKTDRVKIKQVPILRIDFIQMDSAGRGGKTPFQDLRVRRAVAHAIDRAAIAKNLIGEAARVVHSACYPTQFGCTEDVREYAYDPKKAKQLLAEAGYPDGIKVDFFGYRNRQWTEAVLGYLNQVGFKTNLRFLQFQALRPMTRTAEAQFSHLSWGSLGINDISAITSWFFKFSSDDQDRNAQVKEWLEKGDTSTDPAMRKKYYKKALQEIAEQAYWVPLWSYVRFYGLSNDLDFKPHFDDIARFWLAKWK